MLAGYKFVPKLHLRQLEFTYSACTPLTKHCGRIQKFQRQGDLNEIYKNELDKASFAHDTRYTDSKDLAKRIVLDKTLTDRTY